MSTELLGEWLTYASFAVLGAISKPIKRRPSCLAATSVEPDPANG
jgi:hypothetical protein